MEAPGHGSRVHVRSPDADERGQVLVAHGDDGRALLLGEAEVVAGQIRTVEDEHVAVGVKALDAGRRPGAGGEPEL